MIPVQQDRFGEKTGNCFSAAIASLFELSLDEVPNFNDHGSGWWDAFADWCAERGLWPIDIAVDGDYYYFTPSGYYIVSGDSPRGDFQHAVIYYDGEMVHDPHPSGDGIMKPRYITLFTKLFPGEAP